MHVLFMLYGALVMTRTLMTQADVRFSALIFSSDRVIDIDGIDVLAAAATQPGAGALRDLCRCCHFVLDIWRQSCHRPEALNERSHPLC